VCVLPEHSGSRKKTWGRFQGIEGFNQGANIWKVSTWDRGETRSEERPTSHKEREVHGERRVFGERSGGKKRLASERQRGKRGAGDQKMNNSEGGGHFPFKSEGRATIRRNDCSEVYFCAPRPGS